MTRTGADAVVAAYLPEGLDIYLGYIDGNYRSYDAIKTRFPHALVVPIATQPSGDLGTVGDGPPDNGSWLEWVGWVQRRRAAGVDPTMYTSTSQWPVGIQAFNAARVAQPHWWVAQWDDHPVVPAGSIGKQYASVAKRYDSSIFADYWPGVDPKPVTKTPTPPAPTPTKTPAPSGTVTSIGSEKDMILLESPSGANGAKQVFLLSGDLYVHVPDGADFTALAKAGISTAVISEAMHSGILAGVLNLQHVTVGGLGTAVTSTT